MTTHSCLNCHEDPGVCDKVGQDLRSCEHFVRADDIDVEPPDESPDPFDIILSLDADIKKLTQTVEEVIAWRDAFVASVVRASAGEER